VTTETRSGHHAVVEVLARRDADAARDIMRAHNEATRNGLLTAIASGTVSGAVSLV
jgi:DNA-binding GntR family transcriptional regulator